MARLLGFDYKSPYFYMVTLKALKGVEAFSQIGPGRTYPKGQFIAAD